MCGKANTTNQRIAIRILQWLLVANRPLRREELESGIVLDERSSRITPSTKPLDDVLSLCHPIIDVEEKHGGHVTFVHFTFVESVFTAPLRM